MKSMEFDKIVEDINIRTEIIKSFEENETVTFMSNRTSHSIKFTKEDLGEDVFASIIDCMKRIRARQVDVQNKILLEEDTADMMDVAERALSQTRHNSFPVNPRGVESIGISTREMTPQ